MLQKLSEIESFRDAVVGWEIDFIQIDRGSLDISVSLSSSNSVVVGLVGFNRSMYQRGRTPSECRTFGFYRHCNSEVRWLNQYFGQSTLAVFPEDGSFESHTRPGFDAHAITVAQPFLEEVAELTERIAIVENFPSHGQIYDCEPRLISRLKSMTLKALQPQFVLDGLDESLAFDIVHMILTGLADGQEIRRPAESRRRDRAFRSAIELIDAHSDASLTVPQLCKKIGVSERTLRYAFEENMSLSPKAFIQAVRLDRVHALGR